MDREAWHAAIHGVARSWTRLSDWTELKETKDLYIEIYDSDQRSQRWPKQLERYTMFLDWKNQYYENVFTTQSSLQIQCYPYQITNGIFLRTRTKSFIMGIGTQKTLKSQSNLEKEKWSLRNQPSWFQTILQSFSHQESMALAQKHKYKPMEQDRKPRDKPIHLCTSYLWQKRQEYTMENRQSLQ